MRLQEGFRIAIADTDRGHVSLHISSTLSSSAVIKLLYENKSSALLFGPSTDMSNLPIDIQNQPRLQWHEHRSNIECLTFSVEAVESDAEIYSTNVEPSVLENEAQHICHSTGSTADPKSIPVPNSCIPPLACIFPPDSKFIAPPLFHAIGMTFSIVNLAGGQPVFINSGLPYTVYNVEKLLTQAAGRANVLFVNPMILKVLSNSAKGFEILHLFREVWTGGSSISPVLASELSQQGIPIRYLVGSTEAGIMMETGSSMISGWEWLKCPRHFQKHIEFRHFSDQRFELIVKKRHPTLCVNNTEDGYATNDLFVRNSTNNNLWKYWGRKDDVIVHTSGIKTDPVFSKFAQGE